MADRPTLAFDVDWDRIDQMSPMEAFLKGYTLAAVRFAVLSGGPWPMVIRAADRPEVESLCRLLGKPYRLSWMAGDRAESHLLLEVEG